ncbi:MAG: SIS domain-containing protein [Anaerolineae bacterium]|nr:SIS domain-containing protein [Anaerolineae bacterium]
MPHVIGRYLTELVETVRDLPLPAVEQLVDLLHEARMQGRQVFLLGNGGSAATASHFACDLAKNTVQPGLPSFRALSLTDNVALMTAWANDTAYDNVFCGQLSCLLRPGDVVIGISGSGNSPNVLRAMEMARQQGAVTVGLTGFAGGRLRELVDLAIVVPSQRMEQIEDLHLILEHAVVTALRARAQASSAASGGATVS